MRFIFLIATGALSATAVGAQTSTTAPLPQTTPMATPTPTGTLPASTMPDQSTASGPTTAAPAGTVTAPQPIPPTVGATVYGAGGARVGTIKAMDSQFVTLSTDNGEVKLPVAGVGPGLKGPVIGLTAAQLDAAVTQATAGQKPAASSDTSASTTTTTTKRKSRAR